MQHRHFNYRGTFVCHICNRKTRDTGQGVDHLCEPCYEICGMDNAINDGCDASTAKSYRKECERLLKVIVKRGGDAVKVRKCNQFVWPKG